MIGANVIMMYTGNILRDAKSSLDYRWGTVYTGLAQLTGFCISIPLIDKLGRKILVTVSASLVAFSMSLLGTYFLLTEVIKNHFCINNILLINSLFLLGQ